MREISCWRAGRSAVRIAVSEEPNDDYSGTDENYEFLLDCAGIALTDIDEQGKVNINDITFLVRSNNFIGRGEKISVTEVDGGDIFVTKIINNK